MPVSKFHDLIQQYKLKAENLGGRDLLDRMTAAPKFVFTADVVDFIGHNLKAYIDAMNAARAAGQASLAHDPMVVEWHRPDDYQDSRQFWLVETTGDTHEAYCYRLWPALVEPGFAYVSDGYIPISLLRHLPEWEAGDYTGTANVEGGGNELKSVAFLALFYTMALHVRGIVTRPAQPVDQKLDRARAKRGSPPVTKNYVTVHIGFVTDRSGKEVAYNEGAGHHVRVHLRRGHHRNQAYGPGLSERKAIWIPPVLVNYRPGVTLEAVDYLVVP